MEIRTGYGTSGNRVTGPVHVGDPLTLLIYMRSQRGKLNLKIIIQKLFLLHYFIFHLRFNNDELFFIDRWI